MAIRGPAHSPSAKAVVEKGCNSFPSTSCSSSGSFIPLREGVLSGYERASPKLILVVASWAWTLVVNDPEGLRRAGSRMYLADFPPDVRTRTLVSRSKKRLREFVRALDAPCVLKPLAPRGDEHVFYVRRRQISNLNQIIRSVTREGYADHTGVPARGRAGHSACRHHQRREPIRSGDRVAIYRRRPALGPGGAREGVPARGKCDFGAVEARICDILRPKLLADGLHIRGGTSTSWANKLLELNVFHARRHPLRSQELYGLDVADIVIR